MGLQFFYQVREPNHQLLASAAIPLPDLLDKQVSGSAAKSSALGTAGLPSISGVQITTTVNLQLFLRNRVLEAYLYRHGEIFSATGGHRSYKDCNSAGPVKVLEDLYNFASKLFVLINF